VAVAAPSAMATSTVVARRAARPPRLCPIAAP
jgi:hypothetical protein